MVRHGQVPPTTQPLLLSYPSAPRPVISDTSVVVSERRTHALTHVFLDREVIGRRKDESGRQSAGRGILEPG